MPTVKEGVISFTNDEIRAVKITCGKCQFSPVCDGPDDKTNTAVIHPTISVNPSDDEISKLSECFESFRDRV